MRNRWVRCSGEIRSLEDGMNWLGLYVHAAHVQQRVRLLEKSKDEGGEAEEMTEVGVTYDSMQDVLYARSK